MEDIGAQYLCVRCHKITKIKYLNVEYSMSILDMAQYRRQVERFKQVDPDPDLDPKHYYEYTTGLCPKCYAIAQNNHGPDIETKVNQLTAKLDQRASELSIEISEMLHSRIESELLSLGLDGIHTALGQDFDYLYSNSSVFVNKPFSADKCKRQVQILEKHISAIEHYVIHKALMYPMFTLMMDIYKEMYMQDRKELQSVLETDASNFYAIRMISEDAPSRNKEAECNKDFKSIPPEKLFYAYDESIFKMPYPLKFDSILNTVRLENGKVFKKALEVVQVHDNNQ